MIGRNELTEGHARAVLAVPDHEGRRTEARLTERCFSDAELRRALSDAAFDVILADPWSPFDIDAPGKTWWIARKRPL